MRSNWFLVAGGLLLASSTPAAVLCKKRSGVIVVRTACRKKETVLDLAQFGAVGPTGVAGSPGAAGDPGLAAWERPCPPDSVAVGTGCIDKYEASVWRVPAPAGANQGLVAKIRQGTATAADLAAGGAIQLGIAGDDYAPCADSGQNCADDVYAVSLAGVTPSADVTWFQTQAACENARKRLPSNAEWQAAVAGTPDPGPDNGTTDCRTSGPNAVPTGSRASCVSARGAHDMVGNMDEWVADWVPRSAGCGAWSAGVSPTGDLQCLVGAATTGEPSALVRGGSFLATASAGPLSVNGFRNPAASFNFVGFRCSR